MQIFFKHFTGGSTASIDIRYCTTNETKRQLSRLQKLPSAFIPGRMKIDALSLLCWLILLQSHITFVEGLVATGKLETANFLNI